MKKLTIFGKKNTTTSTMTAEDFLDRIKREARGEYISKFREHSQEQPGHPERFVYLDQIPRVCPAVEYRRVKDCGRAFRAYTGLVLVEVDELNNGYECERVKQQAATVPQVRAAFVGCSGLSVKLLVATCLPDGTLPETQEEAELFHAHAYQRAVKCCAPSLSYPISVTPPDMGMTFRMTLDAEPYSNEHVTPLIVEQPHALPTEQLEQGRVGRDEARLRLKPGVESYVTMNRLFNAALDLSLSEEPEWVYGEKPYGVIARLARHCHNAGLPEEETVCRMQSLLEQNDREDVRQTVRNVYAMRKKREHKALMSKKQIAAIRLRDFYARRYEVRYNELLRVTEVRPRRSTVFMFRELDKRTLNSIKYEAALEGIEAFDSEVSGLLQSGYVENYNPVEHYMYTLPPWDGRDRIREVARMVPCEGRHWPELFFRWFLSMVAHWLQYDTEHSNNSAPILVGAQGYRKSTFCRQLLPPELRAFVTDSLDFRNDVEAERYLGRFLLINIDEFDQLTDKQMAFVKHLFQKPVVNIRRSYSPAIETLRRYASFIGTTNQEEVLRDVTGNRRFICVKVTAPIRTEQPIDYEQLYAQALHLITHHERYWINDEDEAVIREENRKFEVLSPLELVVKACFEVAGEDEAGQWWYAVDVYEVVKKHPAYQTEKDGVSCIGRILTKLGAAKHRTNKGQTYWLRKL
jgi:predicted P-loop ATPase